MAVESGIGTATATTVPSGSTKNEAFGSYMGDRGSGINEDELLLLAAAEPDAAADKRAFAFAS